MTKARTQRTTDSAPAEARPVGDGLRSRLLDVEMRIGLLDATAALAPGNRFRAAALLPANAPVPAAMGRLFADELGELSRLGRAADRCHAKEIAGYRIHTLPYFFFDGFNALLAVEAKGEWVAAWKDSEANQHLMPGQIHVQGGDAALEQFLDRVLAAA